MPRALPQLLDDALSRRRRLGLPDKGTDCVRLVDESGDGLPGLEVDCLAGHWVVGTRDADWPVGLEELARQRGARSVWHKRLRVEEKGELEWRAGERVTERFVACENGARFWLDLQAGYSQGLFLDQRLNRARVAEAVTRQLATGAGPPPRVLNTFAYTGGFSVLAARAGAMTTTLDLSQPFLDWARDNFALNGLEADDHYWVRGDAGGWLRRWQRAGRRFHGIVLDPPTFSRRGRKTWSVERDLDSLVAAAAGVLGPGGWLLVSSNCRKLASADFRAMLGRGAPALDWEPLPMPPEFCGEDYLQAAWGRAS